MSTRRPWQQREFVSQGWSLDRAGYGSSALAGDASNTGLEVPKFNPTNNARFLFRLAAAELAPGEIARVLRYRLAATIAQIVQVGAPDPYPYVIEREILSPFWSFVDGNILWSLRYTPIQEETLLQAPVAKPNAYHGLGGTDSGLLYEQYDPGASLYVPAAGGAMPGHEMGGRGSLYDKRSEWVPIQDPAGYTVRGPGRVQLFASVLQTNPRERPELPPSLYPPNVAFANGLRPEDQFLLAWGQSPFNNVQYHRIMGAFTLEVANESDLQGCSP